MPRAPRSIAVARLFVALCIAVLHAAPSAAQVAPASLSGVVRDVTGAVLPGVAIVVTSSVDKVETRTISDVDGRFVVAPLAPGRYAVVAERIGLLPAVIPEIVLTPGTSRSVILELRVPGINEVVSVGADRLPSEAAPSTIAIPPLAVRSVAGAGENIYRVLQTLPGVAAVDDFDSRLTVRGGGPDQNLTMMDGVEIHNPYRLFGLTSAFNPETVENFELITGGFNAKYGDRLSSILVIENRPGTTARTLGASAALALTDGNLVAEGRLPGMNGSSWLVTGRRTYYDLVAERIVDADLPSFADLQFRADVQLRPGHRVTVFGLNSRESTDAEFTNDEDQDEVVNLQTSTFNDLGAATYSGTLLGRMVSTSTVSWYRNRESLDFDGDFRTRGRRSNSPGIEGKPLANVLFTRALSIRDVAFRQELLITAGRAHTIEGGVETHGLDTTWRWSIPGDRNFGAANGSSAQGGASLPSDLDSRRDSRRTGAWITDRWTVAPRLQVEPGIRVDWSGLANDRQVSPRLAVVADVAARTQLRVAGGRFTQSPGYEKLLQSDYFLDLTNVGDLDLRSQTAWHALASIEQRVATGTTVRVEGYYKSFDDLVVGRLETSEEVAGRVAAYDFPDELAFGVPRAPQVTSVPSNGATGRAYGVEVYAARRATSPATRLTGWLSYTWGRAETDAYGRTFAADYDRTHAFSLVASYRVNRLLELATTVRAQSGFPYTPAIAVRPAAIEAPDAAGTDESRLVPMYDATGLLVWVPDYGDVANINTGRLPTFARVDLRLTFRPRWSSDRWQLYLEVINLLNRDNAGSLDTELLYDPTSDRPKLSTVRQGRLPLLPSFGLRYRF